MVIGVCHFPHQSFARDIDPIDFPFVQVEAIAGQTVLAPPKRLILQSLNKTGLSQSFTFLPNTLVETAAYTKVATPKNDNRKEAIPNYLVVPIRQGQTAKPGDIVLTWWQPYSAMNRAIVVGGQPESPLVRYLDIDFNHPGGHGKTDKKLAKDSFHLLRSEWQPGTYIAFQKADRRNPNQQQPSYGQVICVSGRKLVTLEFGGLLSVQDKKTSLPIPIRPQVKPASTVWIAHQGKLLQAVAKSVESKIGRVDCEIQVGKTPQQLRIPFGNILTSKPSFSARRP